MTIFLATKHEKTVMACSYYYYFFNISFIFNFWPSIIKMKVYIHLNSWYYSYKKHKKQKQKVWKYRSYLLIFWLDAWTWNIWGGRTENTSKQKKMVPSFCEELLIENDFETVLVNFYCYDYGAYASETVQKISTRTLELYANWVKQLTL